MELGYRESTESWAAVMRGLADRGMKAPLLAVGDGALGLWAAIREVFPDTAHQEVLEPQGDQRDRQAAQAAPGRGAATAPGHLGCAHEGRSRAAARQHRDLVVRRGPGRCRGHAAAGLGRSRGLLRLPRRASSPPAHQ